MKLIIGLGNPGRKYEGTRHNVGFDLLALLQKRWAIQQLQTRFQAQVGEHTVNSKAGAEKVLLVWPQTFMNRSGTSALAARDFYKVRDWEIMIVCDDFALPLGKLRIRPKGSAGGQNGLSDVLARLGTDEIPRLRIGVGPLPVGWNAADFVLGRFAKDEVITVQIAVERAAEAIEDWLTNNHLPNTMNKFNSDPS